MGNPRGFLDFKRQTSKAQAPKERIKHYNEFYTPLSKESQQIQAGRCMDCGVAFCHTGIVSPAQKNTCSLERSAFGTFSASSTLDEAIFSINKGEIGCPLRNLIPEWNDLIYRAQWQQGHDRLKLTNPFAEFTGRVCPAPCEDSCVCAIKGESVAIKNTELAIIENAFKEGFVKPFNPKKRTNKRVAIIGSGPAGLACANELNALGHNVVVFERSDRIGGLLMYGIPDMKLDKAIVARRVEVMKKSGIEFRVNENINSQARVNALLAEFDALVLATGASEPIDLDIEGRYIEELSGDFVAKSKADSKMQGAIAESSSNAKGAVKRAKNAVSSLAESSAKNHIDSRQKGTKSPRAKSTSKINTTDSKNLAKLNVAIKNADLKCKNVGDSADLKRANLSTQRADSKDSKTRQSPKGLMFAMEFLTANTKSLLNHKRGDTLAKNKSVLIIGSGDTSVDCVAVALRQGAKSITRFERSPIRAKFRAQSNPWPLKKQTFSTDYGLEEAIAHFGSDVRQYQKLTKKFLVEKGAVRGVIAADLEWKNDGGRLIRSEIKGSEKVYKADLVLLAMGFSGSEMAIARDFSVAFDKSRNVATSNYATSRDRIYACGDSRMGQSLVVWAIRDGLECARAIHRNFKL